jgi:hypothetical protein
MTVPYDVYSDVLAVIRIIATGKTPTMACDDVGLSYSTFCRVTLQNAQLGALRVEAEDRLYDLMAEALPRIYDHPVYGVDDPKMAGVVSANIKWLLERRRQKSYGQHAVIEHQITADREVLDALQKAKARAQGFTPIADIPVKQGADPRSLSEGIIDAIVIDETPEERYARELAEIS